MHRLAIPIDHQHVAEAHLLGRQQVGQRVHHVFLNRSLQMPRPVLEVGPFLQKKFTRRRRRPEQKLSSSRVQHSLLHHSQLYLQYLFQLFLPQRVKHHHLIQPVHELRRKFLLRRSLRRPFHLLIQLVFRLVRRLHESHPPPSSIPLSLRHPGSTSEKSSSATNPHAGCLPASASLYPRSPAAIATARPRPSQSHRTAENSASASPCDTSTILPA